MKFTWSILHDSTHENGPLIRARARRDMNDKPTQFFLQVLHGPMSFLLHLSPDEVREFVDGFQRAGWLEEGHKAFGNEWQCACGAWLVGSVGDNLQHKDHRCDNPQHKDHR